MCLTINNYRGHELDLAKLWEAITYAVFGYEVGEKGTPHLQIYIEFKYGVMRGTVRRKLQCCPSFHGRRGTAERASNYCKKGEQTKDEWTQHHEFGPNFGKNAKFEEWGEMSAQGSQLQAVVDAIDEKKSYHEIAKLYGELCIKFGKGIKDLIKTLRPRVNCAAYDLAENCKRLNLDPLDMSVEKCHLLMGHPRIGKTQYALSHFERPLLVRNMDTFKLFNSDYHDGIVIDDMNFTHMPRSTQIFVTEFETGSDIHCRHECAYIPAGTKRIFTCNYGHYPFLTDDDSLDDRLIVHSLTRTKEEVREYDRLKKLDGNRPVVDMAINDTTATEDPKKSKKYTKVIEGVEYTKCNPIDKPDCEKPDKEPARCYSFKEENDHAPYHRVSKRPRKGCLGPVMDKILEPGGPKISKILEEPESEKTPEDKLIDFLFEQKKKQDNYDNSCRCRTGRAGSGPGNGVESGVCGC